MAFILIRYGSIALIFLGVLVMFAAAIWPIVLLVTIGYVLGTLSKEH